MRGVPAGWAPFENSACRSNLFLKIRQACVELSLKFCLVTSTTPGEKLLTKQNCPKPAFPQSARLRPIRSWPRIFCQKVEIVGRAVQPGRGDRENLVPGGRHADSVLELRRQGAVLGHGGPAVAQHFDLIAAGVDHRLDR